jgi:hypothetical protein
MELEDTFENELSYILKEEGFNLRKDEGGFIAVNRYKLGEKVIFFETLKKRQDSFRVRISLWITNEPVQKIHSLVNDRTGSSPVVSFPMSFISKRLNKEDTNFERKKFNGTLGSVVSVESLSQYTANLKLCLRTLILPFFDEFNDQESFNKWLNEPILSGEYKYEIEPIWKDAINSIIISKLICSSNFNKLHQKWLEQDLPKGPRFDTRKELIQLKEILSADHPV